MSTVSMVLIVVAAVIVLLAAVSIRIVREYQQTTGVIAREPGAQTLAEVATEHNSTLVLPIPIHVLEAVRRVGVEPVTGTASNGR